MSASAHARAYAYAWIYKSTPNTPERVYIKTARLRRKKVYGREQNFKNKTE